MDESTALRQYYDLHDKFARGEISGREFETSAYWVASQVEGSEAVAAIKTAIKKGRK